MYRRAIVSICLLLTTCGKETTELLRSQSPADAARLSISPGPIFQFPAQVVGGTQSQVFTVLNTGKKIATELQSDFGLSITFRFEGGFPGTGGSCGSTLAVGASCTVNVTFAPQYFSDFEQVLKVSFHNGYTTALTDYPILRGKGQ